MDMGIAGIVQEFLHRRFLVSKFGKRTEKYRLFILYQ
jgi:hypothetical protein